MASLINSIASSAATTPTAASASTSSTSSTGNVVNSQMIAGNFNEFLQLLTTQLQNQDPLSPLDTNQFTQQLVEFAQVQEQLQSNDQLSTLVSLQKGSQAANALAFVGATVTVNGSSAQLQNGSATWNFTTSKPAIATVTITDSTGQTAYSGNITVQAGQQSYSWNGQGNNGTNWPNGTYNMTMIATDSSGQNVAVSTQVQGTVSSVNLTQNPPLLMVGGQSYPLSQITSIVSPQSSPTIPSTAPLTSAGS